MSDHPLSPKIGTLPDGRSYITYPRTKRVLQEARQSLGGLMLWLGLLAAWVCAVFAVPETFWHTRFLGNLCISDPSHTFLFQYGLFWLVFPVRSRGPMVLAWWFASLAVVTLIVSQVGASTIASFGLWNALCLILFGFAMGDFLRVSNLRAYFAKLTNDKVDIGERAIIFVVGLIMLVLAIVGLNFFLGGQFLNDAVPADWVYVTCFSWGWITSYLIKPKPDTKSPGATVA